MTEPTAAPQGAERAETAVLMAARYGAPSGRRRSLTIGVVCLLAAVLVAWVLWAAWHQATGTVAGAVSAYDVVASHRVDVTVQIHRPPHARARCTVQAEASDHSVVGQTVISLAPSGGTDVQVRTTIKTDREATTAVVSQCR